jgi:hypothetical protein
VRFPAFGFHYWNIGGLMMDLYGSNTLIGMTRHYVSYGQCVSIALSRSLFRQYSRPTHYNIISITPFAFVGAVLTKASKSKTILYPFWKAPYSPSLGCCLNGWCLFHRKQTSWQCWQTTNQLRMHCESKSHGNRVCSTRSARHLGDLYMKPMVSFSRK